MSIYKASELKAFLQSLNIDARKGLSQNFLIDGNILRKIVQAADVQPGDHVLEIGPGPGALTEMLLAKEAHVTAVELDPVFAQALLRLKEADNSLEVIHQDFLEFPLEEHLRSFPSKKKWKVVANLPYHISTPILTKLLPHHELIESVTIMVQKEFGKRMVATPHSSEYSSFTIFVGFYSQAKYCFTIEPTCFYPRPTIQSALIQCQLQPTPTVSSTENFFKLTRQAFQHRRKMMRGSLRELYETEKVERALSEMGLKVESRPEDLSLQQFLILFEKLQTT